MGNEGKRLRTTAVESRVITQ